MVEKNQVCFGVLIDTFSVHPLPGEDRNSAWPPYKAARSLIFSRPMPFCLQGCVKTCAVIAKGQAGNSFLLGNSDQDLRCAGMLQDIIELFLHDTGTG